MSPEPAVKGWFHKPGGRFHPAVQRAKAILDSGELGAIKHIEARMTLFRGIMKEDDIRFDYELGGGAMMDMGCNYLQYSSHLRD